MISFQLLNIVVCKGDCSRKYNMIVLYLVRDTLFLKFFYPSHLTSQQSHIWIWRLDLVASGAFLKALSSRLQMGTAPKLCLPNKLLSLYTS